MSDQLQMTDGMHIIVEALKQNNIDTIYGVVGIPVTDMARHAQAEGIRYIGFRHEQSAGYAAAASGFLTQKPGICLTVSAPGFLNGLTALANATVNGFPMIMISGSSDRAIVDLQQGDYEELDQMNAAKPYAKAAFRVNQPQDLGIALARAIRVSVSGRPGGVYLDLPANVLAATMEKDEALTTIVKVENPSPALMPCPKARRIHKLMNSFVNLLKVLRFHSCQCLWRKGSLKIRIHFLRQLRVRLPWQMLTLSCLLVHD